MIPRKVVTLPAKKVSPRVCSSPIILCLRWPNVILKSFTKSLYTHNKKIGNKHVFTKFMTLLPSFKRITTVLSKSEAKI